MTRERRLTKARTERNRRSRKKAYLQRRGIERFPDREWYRAIAKRIAEQPLRGVRAKLEDIPKKEKKRPVRAFFQRLLKRGVR